MQMYHLLFHSLINSFIFPHLLVKRIYVYLFCGSWAQTQIGGLMVSTLYLLDPHCKQHFVLGAFWIPSVNETPHGIKWQVLPRI